MKSKLCSLTGMAALVIMLIAPVCVADKSSARLLKQQERYTLSLELEFTKKEQNPLEHAISVLFDVGPNGYATGPLCHVWTAPRTQGHDANFDGWVDCAHVSGLIDAASQPLAQIGSAIQSQAEKRPEWP